MNDERFRHIVRRAFSPLVSDAGDGPEWNEITQHREESSRERGPLVAIAVTLAAVAAIVSVTFLAGGPPVEIADEPLVPVATTTTTSPATATTSAERDTAISRATGRCRAGEPKPGIDLRFEDIIRYYNVGAVEQMIAVIGDGPVDDPSLEPERDVTYGSVAEWLAAAERVGDELGVDGYGMGEPFQLFVHRMNPELEADGITGLGLTLQIWANQDCELRVEATDVASLHDPCLYYIIYRPDEMPTECTGPFEPRTGHVAVWTGSEVLVIGGWSDAPYDSINQSPIAVGLDGSIRPLAPPPVTLQWYPGIDAFWTGDRLLILTGIRSPLNMVVLTYVPVTDTWTMSRPLPDDRYFGGAVWTGSDLLLAGGVHNDPDDQAWSYDPNDDTWTQLPDPGIPPVEGMKGVWTGTEAIFYGGYAEAGESPGAAWNPATQTWRTLPPSGRGWIQGHEMIWTGDAVVVYSGHTGPGHPDTLLLYHPNTDTWTESAPIPIPPAERLGSAWTGTQLLIWSGYPTYGDGHPIDQGAIYDPATDTWTVMSTSPLAARCDHTLTWTGEQAFVLGGITTCGSPSKIADGHAALYDPATDEWTPFDP